MRDAVVIGGGLSGLAAAYELEKRGIASTIIEVKQRFGGSIRSRADGGFVSDGCAFAIENFSDESLLDELQLRDQRFAMGKGAFGLRQGSGVLIDALANRLRGAVLMRMALSSVGRLGGRYTLCLENGLMLDAGAVIIAAPARYAERMLRNLAPDAAKSLDEYAYDAIARVSLGYRKGGLPRVRAHSVIYPFVLRTDAPERVPDSRHLLLQIGVRDAAGCTDVELVAGIRRHYGLPAPLIARVDRWHEADPLSCYDVEHNARMETIRRALPEGLFLIGSDYCLEAPQIAGVARLEERLNQGRVAAVAAADFIRRR